MTLTNVLGSDPAVTLLGAILGATWTFFKSSELYGRLRRQRFHAALNVLEAAVEKTYRTYVEAIKEARADGKLTDAEKRRARQLARETAVAFGREQGVDVLRELGAEQVDLWIAKLVKRLKAK
ncbi:MAG TPA: hypothetical protein PLO37_12135 [Candidatus Hydrogenedentes bacterium]|nr:hypothetical protein [Candidatus Hydrogenedentota bacterium]HPG67591.1 hypothetical protein [Candidatus Hydrogenedentota bacterium]